jgi:hypothetical protein
LSKCQHEVGGWCQFFSDSLPPTWLLAGSTSQAALKRPRQKLYIQRILSLSLQFHLRRNPGFFSGALKRTIANSLIELIQPDPAAVGHRQIKMAVIVEITSAKAHNYN